MMSVTKTWLGLNRAFGYEFTLVGLIYSDGMCASAFKVIDVGRLRCV